MSRIFVLFALFCLVQTQNQNNLVLVGQYLPPAPGHFDLKCATTELDKAITWNTPITEDFMRQNMYYPNFKPWGDNQVSTAITKVFSITRGLGLVLDERWEDLTITYSQPGTNEYLIFEKLGTIRKFGTSSIPFSVRLQAEGHIYICKGDNAIPPDNNCYWIMLGGWKGTKSGLRKCSQGQIKLINKGPSGNCEDFLAKNNTTILNKNEWKHFTIILNKDRKTISVVLDGEDTPFLHYKDDDLVDGIGDIYVNSRVGHGGFWKLHNYKVYKLSNYREDNEHLIMAMLPHQNAICISMYVSFCDTCKIALYLKDNYHFIHQVSYYNKAKQHGSVWQKITYSAMHLQEVQNYWLYIRVTQKELGNRIEDVLLSHVMQHLSTNCFEAELKYSSLRINADDRSKVSCEYLLRSPENKQTDPPSDIIEIKPTTILKNPCKPGEVGSICISCRSLYMQDFCQKSIVCESNGCYCSQGYAGSMCQNDCSTSKHYGFGCKESCGNCNNDAPCNNINGTCSNGCADNFEGIYCKEAILPILLEPPEVTTPCTTKCVIKFNPERYSGKIPPAFYRIQYKQSKEKEWITDDKTISINEASTELTGLKKLTNYTLRIYLITKNITYYNKDTIQEINFATSCDDVKFKNTNITTGNISTVIQLKSGYEVDVCNLEKYNISVRGAKDLITVYKHQLEPINVIRSLKPWTTYNVEIFNGNYRIYTNFTTDEGTPGKVKDITWKSSDTTILLEWKEPSETNGNIVEYIIHYEHVRYKSCSSRSVDQTSKGTNKPKKKSIVLKKLNPYSIYNVRIGASTKFPGEMVTNQISTNSSDELDENSYNITITESYDKIELKFVPNCKLIKGRLTIGVTLSCPQYWCNETKHITVPINRPICSVKPVHSFTVYHLKFRLFNSRKNLDLFMKTVTTKPGMPNMVRNFTVYEISDTSLLMRWRPPVPPTGIIEKYIISSYYLETGWLGTKYENNKRSTETVYECKVWSDMMCAELPGVKKDRTYRLTIIAKNKNFSISSDAVTTEAFVRVTAPEQPNNLNATWDNNFNLTLSWEHPDKTNGKLISFTILRDGNSYYTYKVTDYSLTYSYTKEIYPDSPRYKFDVCATNRAGHSIFSSMEIDNPPIPPEMREPVSIMEISNTTMTIRIPAPIGNNNKSYTYVILSDPEPKYCKESQCAAEFIKDYKRCTLRFIKKIHSQQKEEVVVIGDMTQQQTDLGETFINYALQPMTNYTIYIVVVNEHLNFKRFQDYSIQESTTEGSVIKVLPNPSENSAIYACLILLLLPVLFYIYLKKKKVRFAGCVTKSSNGNRADTIPLAKKQESTRSNDNSIICKKPAAAPTPSKFSKLVNLDQFEEYVKESISNGELSRQHALFPRGEQKPNDYGKLPQNKFKNRYMNLVAYNHSRVKLNKINDDEFSDYINASYVNGYKMPNAYIATQGPKPTTVNDFWRMIWEENVHYIVMLANVKENGKKKTEKYWPEHNKDLDFASINVQHISSEIYADYEYKVFIIKKQNEERKVEQVHFTTWPDHGVPLYPQSLVPFLKKLLTFPYIRTSPIVIHCSAGVGRTGTIILIDLCLRMAAETGTLDALNYLHELREQRANMVDNVEQYKLAHLVILECLLAPDTSIPCNEDFDVAVQTVVDNDVKEQMDYIKRSAWQEDAIALSKPKLMNNQPNKNRFPDILPENYGIMYLPAVPGDESSSYINAVTVDGFKSPKRFIATQQPLPTTIGDFWRLVVEDDVNIIISLQEIDKNNLTCCDFWPTKKTKKMSPIPQITLQHIHTDITEHYNTVSIALNIKDEQRRISLIVLKDWSYGELYPKTICSLLAVWQQMNKLLWNENRIVVTCRNGATGCGLYITMCFLLEKIKLEQICDVCHSVRVIRRSRRQFVETEEQFVLLYEIAKLYLTEFELYSNFSTSK